MGIAMNQGLRLNQQLRIGSPYKTGNLRYNGISDVTMLNANSVVTYVGGQRAPYAVMLNNYPIINYKIKNRFTNVVYTGSYVNIHYRWVDNVVSDYVRSWAGQNAKVIIKGNTLS